MLQAMKVKADGPVRFHRGKGCLKCGNSGYRGRVGIYEVLEMDPMIKELVLRRASSNEIKQAALSAGVLRTLKLNAAKKVLEGVMTFEEYMAVAFD